MLCLAFVTSNFNKSFCSKLAQNTDSGAAVGTKAGMLKTSEAYCSTFYSTSGENSQDSCFRLCNQPKIEKEMGSAFYVADTNTSFKIEPLLFRINTGY